MCNFKATGESLSTVVPHCAPEFTRLKLEDLMFGLSLVCTIGKDYLKREKKGCRRVVYSWTGVGLPNRSCICHAWVGEAR